MNGRGSWVFVEGGSEELVREKSVGEEADVEVLRASPVEITGVPTADLVGCPQNDNVNPRAQAKVYATALYSMR
jgi:hypothetical protein